MRNEHVYKAIKEENETYAYPISALCVIANITRSAYYKWLNRETPINESLNIQIADRVEAIHTEYPDMGYRRINDDLKRYHDIKVNDKRVLRICRELGVKSIIKHRNHGCTRRASSPQHIAENVLNREFHASAPNEKWLTDVTEFKYYLDGVKHKVYLSAILDLYDKRIVSFAIGESNDNPLVFNTFDQAITENPGAHPIFHSDRGYQYTNRAFYKKLMDSDMTQSMSRVAKCIDNGPMEGFWGILKRERYYGKRFISRDSLVRMIEQYISYYNNRRLQRNLGILTPIEKYEQFLHAA